ncbi:MAG TPA: GTPase Era [Rhodanobacteraceae bacterium]|nr:GTPase Era [Rhodanobacteraceae bacterium]
MSADATRCGHVALLGRPNVGKSTLLNAMLDFHLSIVGPKPQTTRHRILGIVTEPRGQILFLDTPGLHRGARKAMNRSLNRAARQALDEAELVVQVVEAGHWDDEDEAVWAAIEQHECPRLLAVNKVDALADKTRLLPFAQRLSETHGFDEVHYISARRGEGLDGLRAGILARLPQREPMFDADEMTDRSERFLVAERIREQLMMRLQQELPYATTVEVESFSDRDDGLTEIGAVIWVERAGQKGIVIGAGGKQLKAIGSAARRTIEALLDRRVHLRLWVKVREGWSDDEASLQRFGYGAGGDLERDPGPGTRDP